ncbi:MAG TPA: ferredoxin reductase [Conexibacter sp.]|nr:ferredoxin reductase [Conexibacter sp.]
MGVARGAPIVWRTVMVRELIRETAHACTVVFDVPGWPGHRAGQHVDVRLTAEDGYQAERSYSIASAPEDPQLALTIERIDDGEVSPYLADELQPGDELELRGPIGGPFTWEAGDGGPLLLVGGGSGLVPLMAMLRHHERAGSHVDTRLLVSVRTLDDLLFREELGRHAARAGVTVEVTLTREQPDGWGVILRHGGRIDAPMLTALGPPPAAQPRAYVCGPTPFVEHAADLLVALGHDPAAVRTERFGPTGR